MHDLSQSCAPAATAASSGRKRGATQRGREPRAFLGYFSLSSRVALDRRGAQSGWAHVSSGQKTGGKRHWTVVEYVRIHTDRWEARADRPGDGAGSDEPPTIRAGREGFLPESGIHAAMMQVLLQNMLTRSGRASLVW